MGSGELRVEGNLHEVFDPNGHVRCWLVRRGVWPLVVEVETELLRCASDGIGVLLRQHSTGPRSWSVTLGAGPVYHLRERRSPAHLPDGALYLRDAYRYGVVVAEWRVPLDVRRWFAARRRERGWLRGAA